MRHAVIVFCSAILLAVTGCRDEGTQNPQPVDAPVRVIDYRCGDTAVTFTLTGGDGAEMKIADTTYVMKQAISASGAKYDSVDDPQTYLWGKGNKATVNIKGAVLPECSEEP